MDYIFSPTPLALSVQFPGVTITQGTLFSIGTLPLSVGFGDVVVDKNRAFSATTLQLAVNVQPVGFQRGLTRWTITPLLGRVRLPEVTIRLVDYYEVPQVFPSSREFIPPSFPVTRARTQDGATVKRLWASQPAGGSLRLGFTNISDADANALANLWDRTKGTRYNVTLPRRLFKGMDPALRNHLELNGLPLAWSFRDRPTITSVMPGISNITLDFKARGYGAIAIPIVTEPDPPRLWNVNALALSLAVRSAGMLSKKISIVNQIALSLGLNQVGFSIPIRKFIVETLVNNLEFSPVNYGKIWQLLVDSLSLGIGLSDVNVRFPLRTFASQPLSLVLGLLNAGFERYASSDASFENVTLLLDFDNYLADKSRYLDTTTVTAFNSAAPSNNRSKFGTHSLSLNGSNQYVTVTDRSEYNFGSSDFTIEAWVFQASRSGIQVIVGRWGATATTANWRLLVLATGELNFGYVYGTSSTAGVNGPTVPLNQWCHVTVTSTSGVLRLGVDGVNGAAVAALGAIKSVSSTPNIGRNEEASTWFWNGSIDCIRITSGVSRYQGNTYSVPVSEFSATGPTPDPHWSRVVMLLPMSGSNGATTTPDRSLINRTFTFGGTAAISTANSKYGGSSLALPGNSTSYIQAASTSPQYNLSQIDFTIEGWFYPTTTSSVGIISNRGTSETTSNWALQIGTTSIGLRANVGGTWNDGFISASGLSLTISTWHHFAVVRYSNQWYLYVNGTRVASVTNAGALAFNTSHPINIGASMNNGESAASGNIDDIRVTQGAARYINATYTVPTGPFPIYGNVDADGHDSFLSLHVPGTGVNNGTVFTDASANRIPLSAVGGAITTTSNTRFRDSCIFTDGNGDAVVANASSALEFGTGDFTIQFWVNLDAVNSQSFGRLLQSGDYTAPELNWALARNSTTNPYALVFFTYQNSVTLDSQAVGNITNNTWTFVAVTRWNGTLNCYINATRVVSAANTRNFTGNRLSIGGNLSGGEASRALFQDIKIYKGIALYTRTTLTVPIRPEPVPVRPPRVFSFTATTLAIPLNVRPVSVQTYKMSADDDGTLYLWEEADLYYRSFFRTQG